MNAAIKKGSPAHPEETRPEGRGIPGSHPDVVLWGRLAIAPVYVFAALIFVLYLTPLKSRPVLELPYLLLVLNVFVVAPVSFWIAFLSLRGYLAGGFVQMLFAGGGVLAFGLALSISGLIIGFQGKLNDAVAVHNLGILCSAALHFTGCLLTLRGLASEDSPHTIYSRTALGYGGIAAFMAVAWFGANAGILPPFIIPGEGATPLREVVLAISITLFAASALVLVLETKKRKSLFLRWYGLGLTLTALGIVSVALAYPGSILSWTGRASQDLGILYLLAAVVVAIREARLRGLGLNRAIDEFFQESERHYRNLVEQATHAIISVDPEGKIFLWNAAAESIFGYSSADVAGKVLSDIIFPPEEQEKLKDVVGRGSSSRLEASLLRRDRRSFPAELTIFVSGGQKRPTRTLMIADITTRKDADEALRQSGERFRTLAEASFEGIVISENGRIVDVNEQHCRILGYDRTELLGMDVSRLLLPEDRERILDNILAGRESVAQHGMIRKDGTVVAVEAHGKTMNLGNRVVRLTVIRDLTERKESETKYRTIADNTFDWEFWLGPDREPLYVSPSCRRVTGYDPGDFMDPGLDLRLIHPGDLERYDRHVKDVETQQGTEEIEFRILTKDGRVKWVSHACQPVYDTEGRYLGVRGSNRDITDRKMMEEDLRQNEVRLKAVLDNLPVGVWFADHNGRILYGNTAGQQIWSGARYVDPSEFNEYKAWWADTGKALEPDDWAVARAVRNGETSLNEILKIQCFDGSVKTILNSAVPLRSTEGQLFGVVVLNEDITERMQAEVRMKQLSSFPMLNPNPVVEVDLAGRVTFCNPSAASIFPDLRERGPLHSWLADWKTLAGMADEGKPKKSTREVNVGDRWYHQALQFVAAGPTIRIYGWDITERRLAEEALRESSRRLELLSETAGKLLASRKPEELVNDLCRRVMDYLDCQAFFNYLVDEKRQCLLLNAYAGIPEETAREIEWLDYGVAVCGCAARDACRIVAEDIPNRADPRTDLVRSFGIQAYACHPLLSEGKVIGTLSFGTRTRSAFMEDELALMKTVTDQVAVAMERIRYIQEIKTARQALQESHDRLESLVNERTAELVQSIQQLESEIHERKKVEDALRESEERLYDTLESITDAFYTLDREFRFTYLNEEAEKIWKRSRGELLGKDVFDISPAARGGIFEHMFQKALEEQVPVFFETLGPHTKLWVDVRAYPMREGLAVYVRDITEIKRAEQTHRETALYARTLIEASPDPMVTISAAGKIMDVNRATETATGLDREQLVGSDFSDYFTDPEKAREGYQEIFSKGIVRDYPLAIRHTSGKVAHVLYNASLYRNQAGEVQGIFAVARDISERKRIEEALRESNERLRSLTSELLMVEERERRRLAVSVHDHIAQSLAVAKMKIESLRNEASLEGFQEPIQEVNLLISDAIQQTRSIIAEISPSILYELGFEAAVEWLAEGIGAKHGLPVKVTIGRLRPMAREVEILLYQSARELLFNVVKHARAKGAFVRVEEFGGTVHLQVRDDGAGFNVSRALDVRGDGTGFGLASIRERVEHFNGSLEIDSKTGRGTVVTLTVPRMSRKKKRPQV